jgi:putative transposase
MQGSLGIERMCQLAGVSRASFYRSLQEAMPVEEDMEVRSAIHQIATEHRRRYGYRRIGRRITASWNAGQPQTSSSDHA